MRRIFRSLVLAILPIASLLVLLSVSEKHARLFWGAVFSVDSVRSEIENAPRREMLAQLDELELALKTAMARRLLAYNELVKLDALNYMLASYEQLEQRRIDGEIQSRNTGDLMAAIASGNLRNLVRMAENAQERNEALQAQITYDWNAYIRDAAEIQEAMNRLWAPSLMDQVPERLRTWTPSRDSAYAGS